MSNKKAGDTDLFDPFPQKEKDLFCSRKLGPENQVYNQCLKLRKLSGGNLQENCNEAQINKET